MGSQHPPKHQRVRETERTLKHAKEKHVEGKDVGGKLPPDPKGRDKGPKQPGQAIVNPDPD